MLILSGDHIYKMNYELHDAASTWIAGADVTLATILIDPDETHHFGVVDIDRDGRVIGFEEKPKDHQAAFSLQSGDGLGIDGHLYVQHRCAACRCC